MYCNILLNYSSIKTLTSTNYIKRVFQRCKDDTVVAFDVNLDKNTKRSMEQQLLSVIIWTAYQNMSMFQRTTPNSVLNHVDAISLNHQNGPIWEAESNKTVISLCCTSYMPTWSSWGWKMEVQNTHVYLSSVNDVAET